MPRPPRLDTPGLPQHLVVRGHNRSDIFFRDLDRAVFLKYLKHALATNACSLHAYVLMTNHVHLLATGAEHCAVSGLMHSVAKRYSRYINRYRARSGSLFERRFHSSPVQTDTYLLACMRYIESNPVRAGVVPVPWLYRWSSYRINASGNARGILTAHNQYLALGDNHETRAQAYRRLFDDLPDECLVEFRRAALKDEPAGDPSFKLALQRELGHPVMRGKPGRPGKTNLVLFPQP